MIDLHLHIDGSLTPSDVIHLAKHDHIELPTYDEQRLRNHLIAPPKCDLVEYLKRFELPLKVMQTPYAIEYCVANLLSRLNDTMRYVELRFAPQLHVRKAMDMEQVVLSAIKGIESACSKLPIRAKLILCCMRGADQQNIATIELAKAYSHEYVALVDLAGAENLYPTKNYKELFAYANKLAMPFTIHAGEASGADSVREALDMGAVRIGHGVRLVEDSSLMDRVARDKITLELCPTSNLQTGACENIADYPLFAFMERGISVCINCDNMTVSDTNIYKEYELLERELGLTKSQKKILLENAILASRASDELKKKMLAELASGVGI